MFKQIFLAQNFYHKHLSTNVHKMDECDIAMQKVSKCEISRTFRPLTKMTHIG
jgi:hypothetical protein